MWLILNIKLQTHFTKCQYNGMDFSKLSHTILICIFFSLIWNYEYQIIFSSMISMLKQCCWDTVCLCIFISVCHHWMILSVRNNVSNRPFHWSYPPVLLCGSIFLLFVLFSLGYYWFDMIILRWQHPITCLLDYGVWGPMRRFMIHKTCLYWKFFCSTSQYNLLVCFTH